MTLSFENRLSAFCWPTGFLYLLLMSCCSALAQQPSDSLFSRRKPVAVKKKATDRFSLGGNFSFALGKNAYVDLAPLVGYKFSEKFLAGAGLTYQYSSAKIQGGFAGGHVLGGRAFAQYTLIQYIAPRFEYEGLNVPYAPTAATDELTKRRWIGNPLVGATLNIPVGKKSSFGFTVLYNLNYQQNKLYSTYGSPWVMRMGVML